MSVTIIRNGRTVVVNGSTRIGTMTINSGRIIIDGKPLTITEDVLWQIGFTKAGQEDGAHILVGENAGVSYGLMYNIESKVLRLNGGLIPEPICNVHQLQHALHLCNIQYTIAL